MSTVTQWPHPPAVGQECWYIGDNFGGKTLVEVIEVLPDSTEGGHPFRVQQVDGDRLTFASLDQLESLGESLVGHQRIHHIDGDHPERGAEASAIFQSLITAKEPTDTPDFIAQKAQGLLYQAAEQAAILEDIEKVVGELIVTLEPIYSPPETEAQGVPALEGKPAPLVSQTYGNNVRLSKLNSRLRAIVSGVQL